MKCAYSLWQVMHLDTYVRFTYVYIYIYLYIYIYIYIYNIHIYLSYISIIYIYICVCVCMFVFLLAPFSYMADMIPVLEETLSVPTFPQES